MEFKINEKGERVIEVTYSPRKEMLAFHQRKQRYAVIVTHRRFGKTTGAVNDLINSVMLSKHPNARGAYIAPLLKQAKATAWDFLKFYANEIPGTKINESELRADFFNGAQVRLWGADNPDAMRGLRLDHVIFDEAAQMSPRLYPEIIRPALSDRRGRATWMGTPQGQNEFYDLWKKAQERKDLFFSMMLRASETGYIDQFELDDAKTQMTPEQFAQEYECSFSGSVQGAYYGRDMEEAEKAGRIIANLYDPGLEVHTAWDLGVSDSTVIWFVQKSGSDIKLVDLYASSGYGLDHYAKVIQSKNYKYGRHYFPHDVEHRHQHGGEIARSRRHTLEGLGIPVIVAPKWEVADGINAVRRILPRCWFDKDRCKDGIKALQQYRREWDDVRKIFFDRPVHNWASDYADAFRYLAVCLSETQAKPTTIKKKILGWVV